MTKIVKLASAFQIFMVLLGLLGVIANIWVILIPATIVFALYSLIGIFSHFIIRSMKLNFKNLDKSLLSPTIRFIEDHHESLSPEEVIEAYKLIDQYEDDMGITKANYLRQLLSKGR